MSPDILDAIARRMKAAQDIYGPIASTHEALGVALEEFNELQAAVHANDKSAVRMEACDLAAACIRLAETCAAPSEAFALRSGFTSPTL